ncbi:LysR family transcriptional regulator [Paraburkholderia sp. 22099]|jgi:LysR family transcriptional activator of nhaA|uniref:LysR family transcriptional activator of nhaA n=1 Tax=Paraburkholderia terricola TaxID=169427 RepID=A0A1M6MS98_9BURK|nr:MULTISPECIES: LysR family transcriptional regulator [Paraburkholderia]AXE96545.1 LysR family transcriptional regulator [Paraburkholderia terricola]MDR6409169.1 LysR family transcriptional activator of nhaA [Paraburkholderia terricola]MDR6448609.1 LysR family transcriptional activator of nhaA [Paraburkholderia terricola]MDR6482568.1 LysR family transcriptional activator of nhaA [Paraburkholderia terricola]MDR6494315.1 LysR family transcriptional activator of nhaA [Paraburkholderia terricola]
MLNYRHLYYFWIVVKEGGFARAAERLGMAVQTISAQVRELEKSIGRQLLKPAGRGVTMTEAGQAAFSRAEQIFQLGEALLDEMREAGGERVARLAVGLSDGISKLAAHALLAPVLGTPSLRLLCHEGEHAQLLSELALHRLDLVLACQPAPHNADLRVVSQRLVGSPVDWYGPAEIVRKSTRAGFPHCLSEVPVLLPTGHGALRARLERWFETEGIRPRIAGEFEDSALMAVFAARGLGVFPLAELGADDVSLLRGLRPLGRAEGVIEEIHAIRSRRGQHHALASQVIAAARA